jgi:hypothetical protein
MAKHLLTRVLQIMLSCLPTLLNFVFTYSLYCCGRLSPTLSLVFNFILFGLWTASLCLLASNMQGTLTTTCDIDHWGNDTGVMVCRDYKALFAFLVIAFISHLFAVVLDIIAWRNRQNLGDYDAMHGGDIKLHQRGDSMFSAPGNSNEPRPDAYNAFGTERPGELRAFGVAQPSYSAPYRDYHVPPEQRPAGEAQAYFDDVPDFPASVDAWTRGRPQYSPLRSKADDQTGYEPYRPHEY